MISRIELWKSGMFKVTRNEKGQFTGKKPLYSIDKFERKLGSKKKVSLIAEKELKAIEISLKRSKKISNIFKAGITTTDLRLDKSNKKTIQETYKKLYDPLLSNKSLLPRMIKNAGKLKDSLFYRIKLEGYDKNDKFATLATWNDYGKTVEELIIEYTETGIREQTFIDSTTLKEWENKIQFTNLKGKGDGGIVTKIKIRIEFRYGKR